jgi:tRNA-splicing ligase RtcB
MQKFGNVLSWGSDVEAATIDQARLVAGMPFVKSHVALMADAHIGKGSTIGSVIPTTGAVIPAAVGVDIGCGMAALETGATASDLPDDLTRLHRRIAAMVPAGVGQGHDTDQAGLSIPGHFTQREASKALRQLGSLGSGNHFVEVCLDERDVVWIVLHSGSRGVGNQLATKHIKVAQDLCRQWHITLPDRDLAYLAEGTPEFDAYIRDMTWAQGYALLNRQRMLDAIWRVFQEFLPAATIVQTINTHHNFTRKERHFGKDVWLTRKGAIRAGAEDLGIIPGSMGTRSYITRGKGSPASYSSSSHGAGRRLSRTQAKRLLTEESLREAMAGKAWNGDAAALIDEHPLAYKDVDQVMADQADLVEVLHTLHQVLNYKGT